ncbi:SDR family NAD(P)-dependent oxidoreductase [Photobacterium atrarenae]|uniref:SDR family NAD(P)-dependent oxidoreductase n=1 Tax=Photobacterium atrarenae TaxID=865757 RepID=A0ABY5GMR0_9GAMM|nr:SDR family NAD(P)-dependent oxidoreductase [Photobacterium atrarenae]UTV30071.1 SDR family NAD(P)-dependent oxidoreductase [Photobacterium atrarenae]
MRQVLITGASSGIGAQLARDYAAQGWQVLACGQSQERLVELAGSRANIQPLAFDVTDLQAVTQAFEGVSQLPELIILNAGTCEYIEHGQIDVALCRRVFEVNVFGVLNCIEALQARFDANSHLVIVGSTASYLPLPRAEAYGASKAAVAYITKTLAIDLAQRGVKVSLVSPGFVKTPLTDKNDFAMPMLVSVQYASEKIRHGIAAGKNEIHFPLRFSLMLKVLALLPLRVQYAAIKRMTGKTS